MSHLMQKRWTSHWGVMAVGVTTLVFLALENAGTIWLFPERTIDQPK